MAMRVEVLGLKELEAALYELDKHTTRKSVARKVLKKAAQPLADDMNRLAPDDPDTQEGLNTSYSVSTKLNKRQRRASKKNKSDVEVYAGTNDPAGRAAGIRQCEPQCAAACPASLGRRKNEST